ncbi:uncharacterized protein FYW47_015054 [Aplochiton taeniatus]
MSSSSGYLGDQVWGRGRDAVYTEAINQSMRVPDRLRVGPGPSRGGGGGGGGGGEEEEGEEGRVRTDDPPPAYSMHIPDRLSYADAPDMSARPLFTSGRPASSSTQPVGMGGGWEGHHTPWERDIFYREPGQSPMRRSYSDQALPGTPKHGLHGYTPSSRGGPDGAPSKRPPAGGVSSSPQPPPPTLLSPQSMLQAARELGQQASQRLLQTVQQKYRSSGLQESWLSPEEEGGTAVEFIVLRRQVVKMSRRLAGLERQNAERRQTELVLFSILLSACLLNGWLWIRR